MRAEVSYVSVLVMRCVVCLCIGDERNAMFYSVKVWCV